jgi:hypothetical protein
MPFRDALWEPLQAGRTALTERGEYRSSTALLMKRLARIEIVEPKERNWHIAYPDGNHPAGTWKRVWRIISSELFIPRFLSVRNPPLSASLSDLKITAPALNRRQIPGQTIQKSAVVHPLD